MKPITPQQHAACYGDFIADINKVYPKHLAIMNWFSATLPEIALMYKLNQPAFDSYKGSISSFPYMPKDYIYNPKGVQLYNKDVVAKWATITGTLRNALTKAEVDPMKAAKIVQGFTLLSPELRNVRFVK